MAYGPLQINLRYSTINSQFMYSDNLVKCDYNSLHQKYKHFNSPHNLGVPQTNLRNQTSLFDRALVIVEYHASLILKAKIIQMRQISN